MIGKAETDAFLADKSVRMIWGIGSVAQESLAHAGIQTFTDLLRWDQKDLIARFGSTGYRLWHLARRQDWRKVSNTAPTKSISNETTFFEDTASVAIVREGEWPCQGEGFGGARGDAEAETGELH